nr:DUF222 domain-containing protein [Mycobacterium sp. IS-1742]
MDGAAVLTAFAEFEAARDALAALPLETLTVAELLTVIEMRERGHRRDLAVDHALTARLIGADPHALGATSIREVLANHLRITPTDARNRITDATQLGPRYTIHGERVQTELGAYRRRGGPWRDRGRACAGHPGLHPEAAGVGVSRAP